MLLNQIIPTDMLNNRRKVLLQPIITCWLHFYSAGINLAYQMHAKFYTPVSVLILNRCKFVLLLFFLWRITIFFHQSLYKNDYGGGKASMLLLAQLRFSMWLKVFAVCTITLPSSKIPLSVDKGANFSSLAISTASSPSPSNSAQAVQRSWFGILTCLLREGYWLLIQVFPEVRFKIILIKSRDIKTSNGWRGLHQHLLPVKHPQGRAAVSLKKRLDWRAHLCEERLIIHSGRWIAASLLKWYLLNSQYWQRP